MGGRADEPHCRYTDGGRGGHLRSEQDTKVRGVLNGKINDTNAFCIWRKRCVHIEVSWGFPGGRAGGCYLVGGRRNGVQGVGGWSGREARPTLYIPSTGTIQDDQMGMGVQSVDARGTPALHRPCITNQWQWVSDGQSFGAFAVSLSLFPPRGMDYRAPMDDAAIDLARLGRDAGLATGDGVTEGGSSMLPPRRWVLRVGSQDSGMTSHHKAL